MAELKDLNGSSRARHPSMVGTIVNTFFHIFSLAVRFIFQVVYRGRGARMPPITDPILMESATSLAAKIRNKEVTSVQVVKAFIERIKLVQPILNCCVDNCFDDALKEAEAVDKIISMDAYDAEEMAKTKPFLGVPISTKDCIAVKGMINTAGLYCRKNVRATEDSVTMSLMRQAGAIPFCLTNVSEVCMWWESNNILHGRTLNPYDTNRIVGGSSGGEGCIQAAAASPFGLGSDVGGSLRMPAFFNGIFCHKPSKNIVSNKGQFPMPFSEEQNSFLGTGPMVRFAVDLKPIMKIIASDKAPLLRLDEPVDLLKLRFFYQEDDGGGYLISPVDKEIRDSMRRVVKHLKHRRNLPVERVKLEKFRKSADIWFANMKDDSGYGFVHQLANLQGAINPYVELLHWLVGNSKHTFIGLLTAIMDKVQCQHGSRKYHQLVQRRNEFRQEIGELLGDDGVLIYPTHPTVAPYHNEPILRPMNFSYTAIVNVLGLPSSAVPLGLNSEGLPLGVQIIANVNQDRLCIAVAEELERAFGGWVPPEVKF